MQSALRLLLQAKYLVSDPQMSFQVVYEHDEENWAKHTALRHSTHNQLLCPSPSTTVHCLQQDRNDCHHLTIAGCMENLFIISIITLQLMSGFDTLSMLLKLFNY